MSREPDAPAGVAGDGAPTSNPLFASLYAELHRLAEAQLRRGGGGVAMGPTTLLHEAYLDIAPRAGLDFPDAAHFLAYAARAMRGLVIDRARGARALKRGGDAVAVTLSEDSAPGGAHAVDAESLERLGDALDELAAIEPALAQLVDLHFFAGLSFAELAALRGVSDRTVQRDWRKARLLLHDALGGAGDDAR